MCCRQFQTDDEIMRASIKKECIEIVRRLWDHAYEVDEVIDAIEKIGENGQCRP